MNEIEKFPGLLALQQRVLPAYRAPLFDMLARACEGGLSVFAGDPLPDEQITTTEGLEAAQVVRARNHHFLNVRSPFYQCWQSGLLGWLEGWDPDALIVEANPRYPSTRLAVRWMHSRGRPVIGWGLGATPLHGPLASLRRWNRWSFLRSLDGLIAYSHRGAEEYRVLGYPEERTFVATNAVSPRPEAPPPDRPAEFIGQPVVLFVGRLQERKRIDNLLRACAALPTTEQPRLVIVGDGPARESFESLAGEVYPNAVFTGALYGADLEAAFAQADLFVLPGTGGLAVQQAMTFGLPVVVAQGDGTQEDLVRGDNGWIVPPDDLDALTSTLREALPDPRRLRRFGVESYRIVSEEINIRAMVAVFLRVLYRLRK